MISLIGGTGPEGRGLALRFALAGHDVIIGSRDKSKAELAVESLKQKSVNLNISGLDNLQAAKEGDIVFIAVPFGGHKETLESLRKDLSGKIVVDVVAPLKFSKGKAMAIDVPEGSAALQAQALLPDSRIVASFHNVSAEDLLIPDKSVDCDIISCSEFSDAREDIMNLSESIDGARAVNGGSLDNARYVENLTALLLNINRTYKAHSSIRIVGL